MTANDDTIPRLLLHWYDEHARTLPWRARPGEPSPSPYRVWLSEIMLQQTTVAAVKPYFAKFLARWPTVQALAEADEAEVMSAWAGLGYYSRARNLVKCAREVAARGGFPQAEAELRKLPGLGPYTAAAVAAIAFGARAVVIDANVERVVARLCAIADPLPRAKPLIRDHADLITPELRAGDFAQAMMDLGARICTARSPNCGLCPLKSHCQAKQAGDPARYPVKSGRKPRPERRGSAYWIERDGMVWLVTRPANRMLGGMRSLPDDGWTAQADGSGAAPSRGNWRTLGAVKHVFTHASLSMEVLWCENPAQPQGSGEWWPIDQLDDAGLPTLYAKAARLALAARS